MYNVKSVFKEVKHFKQKKKKYFFVENLILRAHTYNLHLNLKQITKMIAGFLDKVCKRFVQ